MLAFVRSASDAGDSVNLSTIYKVFDTVVSVLDAKKDDTREQTPSDVSQAPQPSFADQVEARLTNVVVAALKEAFDRDHARLELERAHLQIGSFLGPEHLINVKIGKFAADFADGFHEMWLSTNNGCRAGEAGALSPR